jgi:sensor histidine kinase YesM
LYRYIYLHIVGWFLFFAYETVQHYFANGTVTADTMLQHGISFLQACIFTYVVKLWVLDKIKAKGNWVVFFLLNCLLCFAISFVQQWLYLITYKFLLDATFGITKVTLSRQLAYALTWMRPVASWMVAYYIIKLQNQYYGVYVSRLRTLIKQKEADLLLLKKGLNPAFVFRSLKGIAGLTEKDAAAAQAATLQFAYILRHYLEKEQQAYISLAKELEVVSAYLSAESRHLHHRFSYTIEASNEAKAVSVAPAMVLEAVENAVEHGVGKSGHPGWISLTAFIHAGYCHIEVLNAGTLLPDEESKPVVPHVLTGIENIQQQLDYLYSGKATVTVCQRSAGIVGCSFKIPI